jgi:hypothetical protein
VVHGRQQNGWKKSETSGPDVMKELIAEPKKFIGIYGAM